MRRARKRMKMTRSSQKKTRRKRTRARATMMTTMRMTTPLQAWRARRSSVRKVFLGMRWRDRLRKRTARLPLGELEKRRLLNLA